MDGFSAQWGFSLADIGANTLGIGIFAAQQKWLGKQVISIKESVWPVNHNNQTYAALEEPSQSITLNKRAEQLFGTSLAEQLLKDYNAQTYWASFNINALLSDGNKWPSWLNIALGYSAKNMYGGFENKWTNNGLSFDATDKDRYRQYFLALDLNLPGIKTQNPTLRTILNVLNIFKTPSPAIEFNSRKEIHFHLVYY